jgi:hypothetical protein
MEVTQSRNGVPIRLTDERWLHITEEHSEMAGYFFEVLETVQEPEAVYEGKSQELLATREIAPGRHLIVIYRELSPEDGFVITAFLTTRITMIDRRRRLWPR